MTGAYHLGIAGSHASELESLSHLIGSIYDCALDPSRWEPVIGEICRQFAFDVSTLLVMRLPAGAPDIKVVVGMDPAWVARSLEYQDDLMEVWGGIERVMNYPLDEPIIASRVAAADIFTRNRYAVEFALPMGIRDAIAFMIARTPTMLGSISFNRREPAEPFGDREIGWLRLIAPHVRRAVTIGDLFDMRTVAAATFDSVLDKFAFGIALVDASLGIVHANESARAMLATGVTIRSEKGRLVLPMLASQEALERAVRQAAIDEAGMNGRGIGIPLPGAGGQPAVVHVLPLRHGEMRRGVGTRAVAALFVAPAALPPSMPADALAAIYDLTPAETRIFELIAAGRTQTEAAAAVGIATSTVKSHLLRLFAKTGCRRQADLMKLATSLSSPA